MAQEVKNESELTDNKNLMINEIICKIYSQVLTSPLLTVKFS